MLNASTDFPEITNNRPNSCLLSRNCITMGPQSFGISLTKKHPKKDGILLKVTQIPIKNVHNPWTPRRYIRRCPLPRDSAGRGCRVRHRYNVAGHITSTMFTFHKAARIPHVGSATAVNMDPLSLISIKNTIAIFIFINTTSILGVNSILLPP